MKLVAVFSELFVGLLLVQLGDSCGGTSSINVPSRKPKKTSINESAVLEIIHPRKDNSVSPSIVEVGARRGLEECQRLFENEMWNCPSELYKKLPIFDNTTFPFATRHTAFIHAINAAAITYEITHQCTQGKISGCGCPSPSQKGNVRIWGCGDNIEFGEMYARHFTDRLEKGQDAQAVVNRHNNEVGREVVRTSAELKCKCHGLANECSGRTCWKELAPFEVVASKLKQKYDDALRVQFVDNKLRVRGYTPHPITQTLVYLESTKVGYCVRNYTLGFPGMLGRSCRSDVSKDKCELFIAFCKSCKLRVKRVERYKKVKCKCRFVWCCKTECNTCMEKYSEIICSSKAVEKRIEARAYP